MGGDFLRVVALADPLQYRPLPAAQATRAAKTAARMARTVSSLILSWPFMADLRSSIRRASNAAMYLFYGFAYKRDPGGDHRGLLKGDSIHVVVEEPVVRAEREVVAFSVDCSTAQGVLLGN